MSGLLINVDQHVKCVNVGLSEEELDIRKKKGEAVREAALKTCTQLGFEALKLKPCYKFNDYMLLIKFIFGETISPFLQPAGGKIVKRKQFSDLF